MITRAYKFRMYPNERQKNLIKKTFGCTRFVYNYFLDRKITLYNSEKKNITFFQCCKELTALKREYEWLREPDKFSLQNSLKDLDSAFEKFFTEYAGFPKFKSKKKNRESYKTNFTNNNIEYLGTHIKLPKLGKVKIRDKQIPEGRILNATVSQTPSGKYFVSLCCTDVEAVPYEKKDESVGIDVGISNFIILSNGIKYKNPKYLDKSLKKLAKLQKELSRKTRGGSNYKKVRLKIARLYEHITNQRKDYLHKTTTELVKNYDNICVENIDIKKLLQEKKLSKEISDVSWYEFSRQLEYKCNWYEKKLIKIDKYYPSSQICNKCGYKNENVKNLYVRKWACPICGELHDRDINASINILNEGLRSIS